MWSDKRWYWLVGAALTLALFFRLPSFGSFPDSLNRDEASLGYNAWLIAHTGKDEWEHLLPIRITSFGDEKLPGYVYALTPLLRFVSPTPALIRLPSLLAGLAVIVLAGTITSQVAPTFFATMPTKQRTQARWLASGFAMLSLAVSPWAVHFSRIAYEAHLALALFLGGLIALIPILQNTKTAERKRLILTALSWSLALTTYHSYHVFLPIFGIILLALFWRRWLNVDRFGIAGGVGIGVITLITLFLGGIWSANTQKVAGISVLSPEKMWTQVAQYRAAIPGENSLVDKVFSNLPLEQASTFATNWSRTLTPSGLFATIPGNHVHNVTGVSNLHLLLLPLCLIGIGLLWEYRRTLGAQLLASWLFAATLAPALTLDPQHTVRLSPLFPGLEVVAALAASWVFFSCARRWRVVLSTTFLMLAVLSISRWWLQYRYIGPMIDQEWSDAPYHQLAHLLKKYANTGDVITNHPRSSPYIWYTLLNRMPGPEFWKSRVAYPKDREGFQHIAQIGSVQFRDIVWEVEEQRYASGSATFILAPNDIPSEKRTDVRYTFLEEISGTNGKTRWEVWRYQP